MYHYRKTRIDYKRHNAADTHQAACTLCNELGSSHIIMNTKMMFILPNRVSYDLFEGRRVLDHLMVIPKRHVESMKDFTEEEARETMRIMGEYEEKGYNVYARAKGSIGRSVKHQHTHLIKTDDRPARAILYARKPYFLFKV